MSTNLDDLKNTALPAALEWSVLGHNFVEYHVAQTRAGHRQLPVLRLNVLSLLNVPKEITHLDQYADDLKYISDNELPLVLRHQSQWSGDMTTYRGTGPDDTSAVEWRIKPDGTLDSKGQCDYHASPDLWRIHGETVMKSAYIKRVMELCPNPSKIIILDNNEGAYPSHKNYSKPTTAGVRRWLPDADLRAVSIRMADYVLAISTPNAFYAWPDLQAKRRAQYDALLDGLYAGFDDTTWDGLPLVTGAYSAAANKDPPPPQAVLDQIGLNFEGVCYDFCGPSQYIQNVVPTGPANLLNPGLADTIKLNIPAWDWLKAQNPDAGRCVFVSITGKSALVGALAGVHEFVSPDIFRAWCEYMLWMSHATLAIHWIGNSTKPSDLFFGDPHEPQPEAADADDIEKWQERIDDARRLREQLATIGRMDVEGLTHEAYSQAPALACDSICVNAREFWLNGEAVDATSSDARAFVHARKLGEQYMVYAWSPCKLSGNLIVTLATREVVLYFDAKPSVYWTSAPPPPPKTPADTFWESHGGRPKGYSIEEADKFYDGLKAAGLI